MFEKYSARTSNSTNIIKAHLGYDFIAYLAVEVLPALFSMVLKHVEREPFATLVAVLTHLEESCFNQLSTGDQSSFKDDYSTLLLLVHF